VQRIEPVEEGEDERGIDPNKALVLRGEHDKTRATGFFRTNFAANAAPQRLSWGDKAYRYIGRALEADVLLVTATRFDLYPDLHLTSSDFAKETKVSDGGAQMAPFLWGSAELMSFKNAKGVPLQAAVYKPANFDPKKKYPLIVYIYEKLSQDVHQFRAPSTGQNINFSVYTSNGYIVMTPDIVYTTGYPGKSAMDAVLPAIDTLAKQGFVDEKSIGIQGHSWGGYQIAYMVTQTNRFRAAEAGAPVGNMTSAYSGIRWGSGLPRQFQYEHSQSRIGKTLQDAPDLFIANSAVFHAKKVQTPLLILANDNDDAVPFYQGIELFLALRRHGKEAFYFNYNGEYHALRRRADQKDFGRRMQQFFDHYLKGAPAPEWMTKGIPYIEREEEKERFASMVSNASASTSASAAGNASSNASAK
jgi:dipeptidyl aminopeptidase/acylaminoacyl peptidase